MGGDVPGKILVAIGGVMTAALLYLGVFSGTSAYVFWALSVILIVLGLINWGVK
ncbi:MAG: hypothetical protein UY70_C0005G0020 [Candidatus Kaiserbacteria bacterium GW2011_GWB1_52_6]|uniref:Uncharacterized protein n=3 Tax=Candidatus Kaiseribacteriota TaxID=1752734 RepID=A0A0G1XL26_9BACT|nr:MAG: hypothetical protein UY67_C0004G0015 [Candidatus Kaiserbacteria bacterium GW2011_GWA2_52_12]KKW27956.1 MAG: hypothetical protein UY70_C0005G0020 [Candidatus Kaiserbacteria bacterium GW2011_GWB1_52_6]KKW31973.1 MAG: hypothetical protein UY74_C0002G0009 [Candidatus Kaiserbacteria bacterium GW2011_GWC2_52_8b]